MKRPKINIVLHPMDWVVEGISALALLGILFFTVFSYIDLPESVPTHYDETGAADAYGSKVSILVLLIVTMVMYGGLLMLNRYPHIFNYPKEITEDNAEKMYRGATRLIRGLNFLITLFFAYLIFATIQGAGKQGASLGKFFLPIFLISIFGLITYYLVSSFRNNKK